MSISCRHPEYPETAAPSITGPTPSSRPAPSSGPAPAASTKRAVSNGTVETMRQKSACCLGSSSCLQSEHLTPKSYLYHLLQNSENLQLKHFYWTKPDVFLGLTNSLTSALRARLAVVHLAFIGNTFFQGCTGEKFTDLRYLILILFLFLKPLNFFLFCGGEKSKFISFSQISAANQKQIWDFVFEKNLFFFCQCDFFPPIHIIFFL